MSAFWRSDALQDGIEAPDQSLAVYRLAEEAGCATRFCASANPLFGEGGNEDHGHPPITGRQLTLQFKSAHPWHLDIHDKA